MAKTLCEWKKHEILEDIEDLAKIVSDPRFVCKKCARVAHADKHLCKAMKLPLLFAIAEHSGDKDRD